MSAGCIAGRIILVVLAMLVPTTASIAATPPIGGWIGGIELLGQEGEFELNHAPGLREVRGPELVVGR